MVWWGPTKCNLWKNSAPQVPSVFHTIPSVLDHFYPSEYTSCLYYLWSSQDLFSKPDFFPPGKAVALPLILWSLQRSFFSLLPQLNRRPETWREHPAWFSFTISSCWNSQVAWLFSLMVICDVLFVLLPCYPVSHAVTESAVSRKMPRVCRGRAIIGSRCLGSKMLASCPRLPTPGTYFQNRPENQSPSQGPVAGQERLQHLHPHLQLCPGHKHRSLSCLPESSFLAALPSSAAPLPPWCPPTFPWSGWFIFSFFPLFPVAGVPRGCLGQHPPSVPRLCGSQQVKPSQSWRDFPVHSVAEEIHLLLFFLEAQKQDIPFLLVACSLWNIPTDVLLPWVCLK